MSDIPRYQELLNELNQLDWGSLYQEGISTKERIAYLKLGRQRIRHVKNQIRQEKDFIKARYDGRNKTEALAQQIALLPFLALEKLISQLELSLAELETAVETNMRLPDPFIPGDFIVEERTSTQITWQITTRERWERDVEVRENDRIALVARQMEEARRLIAAKEYEQAKRLLETIDDPAAVSALDRVNETLAAERVANRKQAELEFSRNRMADQLSNSSGQSYSIVCPKCGQQTLQSIDLQRLTQTLSCPKCKTAFFTNVYRIRANRSRSAGIGLDYSVRVLTPSGEENLINFTTLSGEKMELRSQDVAGFSYLENRLMIIQNFTIDHYWRIGWSRTSSPLLTIVLVLLIVAAIAFYFLIQMR